MITKQTSVNKIEITSIGFVQIRLELSLVESGNKLSSQYHRMSFPPGANIDNRFSSINLNLDNMTYPAISNSDIENIRSYCNIAWTPEVILAYQSLSNQH